MRRGVPIVLVLLLGACGPEKQPIAINGYCEVKKAELIDMTDKGLQGLTPINQGAVLTGDDNWRRICVGSMPKSGGPR